MNVSDLKDAIEDEIVRRENTSMQQTADLRIALNNAHATILEEAEKVNNQIREMNPDSPFIVDAGEYINDFFMNELNNVQNGSLNYNSIVGNGALQSSAKDFSNQVIMKSFASKMMEISAQRGLEYAIKEMTINQIINNEVFKKDPFGFVKGCMTADQAREVFEAYFARENQSKEQASLNKDVARLTTLSLDDELARVLFESVFEEELIFDRDNGNLKFGEEKVLLEAIDFFTEGKEEEVKTFIQMYKELTKIGDIKDISTERIVELLQDERFRNLSNQTKIFTIELSRHPDLLEIPSKMLEMYGKEIEEASKTLKQAQEERKIGKEEIKAVAKPIAKGMYYLGKKAKIEEGKHSQDEKIKEKAKKDEAALHDMTDYYILDYEMIDNLEGVYNFGHRDIERMLQSQISSLKNNYRGKAPMKEVDEFLDDNAVVGKFANARDLYGMPGISPEMPLTIGEVSIIEKGRIEVKPVQTKNVSKVNSIGKYGDYLKNIDKEMRKDDEAKKYARMAKYYSQKAGINKDLQEDVHEEPSEEQNVFDMPGVSSESMSDSYEILSNDSEPITDASQIPGAEPLSEDTEYAFHFDMQDPMMDGFQIPGTEPFMAEQETPQEQVYGEQEVKVQQEQEQPLAEPEQIYEIQMEQEVQEPYQEITEEQPAVAPVVNSIVQQIQSEVGQMDERSPEEIEKEQEEFAKRLMEQEQEKADKANAENPEPKKGVIARIRDWFKNTQEDSQMGWNAGRNLFERVASIGGGLNNFFASIPDRIKNIGQGKLGGKKQEKLQEGTGQRIGVQEEKSGLDSDEKSSVTGQELGGVEASGAVVPEQEMGGIAAGSEPAENNPWAVNQAVAAGSGAATRGSEAGKVAEGATMGAATASEITISPDGTVYNVPIKEEKQNDGDAR